MMAKLTFLLLLGLFVHMAASADELEKKDLLDECVTEKNHEYCVSKHLYQSRSLPQAICRHFKGHLAEVGSNTEYTFFKNYLDDVGDNLVMVASSHILEKQKESFLGNVKNKIGKVEDKIGATNWFKKRQADLDYGCLVLVQDEKWAIGEYECDDNSGTFKAFVCEFEK